MFNVFLSMIVVVLGFILIITENATLMPVFVILLGISTFSKARRDSRNNEDEDNHFGPYMSITIFGLLLAYFLFSLFSGHLY